ncbi:guanylate kinase [Vararia minispora EC-137]|uniref:Guanylate kinase n=1 Tax=Vararia minispora EC-137 TaxID=1314806 RepID=A0ACB8Q9R4_9AGAM|nr:guanylate kinase [Vararia minispora EC-137]
MSSLPDFVRPLVCSGPSGVGKSTLLKRLFSEFPDKFAFSVSHTTRAPRPSEVDGKDYNFTTRDAFLRLVADGGFIEHAEFSGNLYGTSVQAVKSIAQQGRRCILDIEVQGVRQIKTTDLNPVYLFVAPPSVSVLRQRLIGRGTDSVEAVQKRLQTALLEIGYAKEPGAHDYVLVNDDLERAYDKFRRIALGGIVESDTLPPLDD